MDARVYFQLTDSITDSTTAAELAAMRDVVRETPMHPREHRALERLLQSRETDLESRPAPNADVSSLDAR
jgi:hypothetical protein